MKSINPYDIFKWIEKNIESCINARQVLTCNRLIQNFEKYYPNYNKESYILRSKENLKYWEFIDKEYENI
jgi:hypothetical protein